MNIIKNFCKVYSRSSFLVQLWVGCFKLIWIPLRKRRCLPGCLAEYILSRVCLSIEWWAARPASKNQSEESLQSWYFLTHGVIDHFLMNGVVDHCQSWVACYPTFCRSEPSLKDKWFATWVATRPLQTNRLHLSRFLCPRLISRRARMTFSLSPCSSQSVTRAFWYFEFLLCPSVLTTIFGSLLEFSFFIQHMSCGPEVDLLNISLFCQSCYSGFH